MNKKRSVSKVFIAIGIAFSFIVLCTFGFLIAFDISSDNRYFKQSREIIDKFSPWCTSERYVCYESDIHWLTSFNRSFDLDDEIKTNILQKDPFLKHIYFNNYILYLDNHIYFCAIENLTDTKLERLAIYKTDIEGVCAERIATIGEAIIESYRDYDYAFGYSEEGYFRVKDKFYIFDFINEKVNSIEKNDVKALYSVFDNYLKMHNIGFSKCEEKEENINFLYQNIEYTFEVKKIESQKYQLIKYYKFNPSYCISFDNGLTSIVYYGISKFSGNGNCLILTYNRVDNQIIDYQLFTNVSLSKDISTFFPKLVRLF